MIQGALGWHGQVWGVGGYRRGSCGVPEVSCGSYKAGAAHGEAEWSLQPWKPRMEQDPSPAVCEEGDAPEGGCDPKGCCAGAPERERSPLQPVKDSPWNISNISFPRKGALLQQGKDEEEEVAETVNV